MDGDRFDVWSKVLVTDIDTRRVALRRLIVTALVDLLARLGPVQAADIEVAACRLVDQKCGRHRRCCAGARCKRRRCRCRAGFTRCDDSRCRACAAGEVCIASCCRPNNASCADVCQPNTSCPACCFGFCDGVGTCQVQ